MKVIVTKHAYDRAKERFKWNTKTVNKMALKALKEGTEHHETKGKFKKYISSLWARNEVCNNIRIYGENLYLFTDNILITLYRCPQEYIKYLKI